MKFEHKRTHPVKKQPKIQLCCVLMIKLLTVWYFLLGYFDSSFSSSVPFSSFFQLHISKSVHWIVWDRVLDVISKERSTGWSPWRLKLFILCQFHQCIAPSCLINSLRLWVINLFFDPASVILVLMPCWRYHHLISCWCFCPPGTNHP